MREKIDFNPDYGTRATTSIIKVIGVGGGGGNAVSHMYQEGIVGVDFLICNTDKMSLDTNPIPTKLVLGSTGLGAGAHPEIAKQFAEEDKDKIIDFIGKETKMLFITAGLGKGTGTGASPVIARLAKEMGILTIAVVTVPFDFEGDKAADHAQAAIAALKDNVDSLIIIKNENLFKYYNDDLELDMAYGYVDDILKNAVKCIAELITVNLDQNIDFNDVKSIMQNSGVAMLAIAEASGEDRVDKVFDAAFNCPLLSEEHITNARNFLFSVNYGPDKKLTIGELKKLTSKLNDIRANNARVIWGKSIDDSLKDKIKLSVIVCNFDSCINNQRKETNFSGFPEEEPIEPFVNSDAEGNVITKETTIFKDVFFQSLNGVNDKSSKQVITNDLTHSHSHNVIVPNEGINVEKTDSVKTITQRVEPIQTYENSVPQPITEVETLDFSNDKIFSEYIDVPAITHLRREGMNNSQNVNSKFVEESFIDDDSNCFYSNPD